MDSDARFGTPSGLQASASKPLTSSARAISHWRDWSRLGTAERLGFARRAARADGHLARPLGGAGDQRADQRRVRDVRPEPQKHVQQDGQQQDPGLPIDRRVARGKRLDHPGRLRLPASRQGVVHHRIVLETGPSNETFGSRERPSPQTIECGSTQAVASAFRRT